MRGGANLTYVSGGGYSASDHNGGAIIQGGNIGDYKPYINALNSGVKLKQSNTMTAPSTSVMALAIAIIPQALFVPQPFVGVPLPHLICCPENKRLAQVTNK